MFQNQIIDPILDSIENFQNRNSFFINETFYSYREFGECVSKIRIAIQGSTIKGPNIGLIANDDLDTYAAIIAIWLEGYAYVPVHPKHPIERGLEIIEQAGIGLLIDSSDQGLFDADIVIETRNLFFQHMELNHRMVSDDVFAYILFTSGSTGKPKGVPITRKNVAAFMDAFWKTGIEIDENDRCLQCFDLTFDVSVQSFLIPLTRGACTYTIPHDQIKFSYAYGLLDEHRLTFGAMAPSLVRFLRPYFNEIELPDMKYNILTAEASPLDLLEEWSICIPNAEIYDFYGPTEATIYCTYYKLGKDAPNKQYNGMLSIGKPMDGINAIITDKENRILSTNQKGELCISGDQVTVGYWNSQEKSDAVFFLKDIGGEIKRFYKTGDLCYKDDEGDIMYSGRLDFQVKIQGFRIELGDIEHHVREYLEGRNIVAVAFENNSGNSEIALFVEGKLTDLSGLKNHLKSKLPNYMIPSRIIERDQFPLNSNSKVDRNILKELIT